ncbi:MAG: PAS-domain containing protein [Pseudomonadota bacterium]
MVTGDGNGLNTPNFDASTVHNRVLKGLNGERSIDDICRDEGITRDQYRDWLATFVSAGQSLLYSMERPTDLCDVADCVNLSDIINSLDQGLALYDSDMRFVMANKTRRNMFTMAEDVLKPGRFFKDIISDMNAYGIFLHGDGVPANDWVDVIVDRVRRYDKNIAIRTVDGRHYLEAVHRTSGNGYLITIRDVTDQYEERRAEREVIDLLEKVVEACPANFLMSRVEDGEVLYRSPASEDLFGQQMSALGHWAYPADRLRYLDTLNRRGRVDDMFVIGLKSDGSHFPSQVSARLIEYRGEKVIVSSTTDLTEAIAQREETERVEELLVGAIKNLPVGVALEDTDGRITHCNQAFADFYNCTPKDLYPLSFDRRMERIYQNLAFVQGQATGEDPLSLHRALAASQRGSLEQIEGSLKDGRHYLLDRAPTNDDGRIVIMTDVTIVKEAEARTLAGINDAIQALDEALILFDKDLNFVMGNRKLQEFFFQEIPRPEVGENIIDMMKRLAGTDFYDIPEGVTDDQFVAANINAIKNYAQDVPFCSKSGRTMLASCHKTALGGYLISFNDITERLRAEESERQTDALIRMIVESSPVAYVVSRMSDGEVIYATSPRRNRLAKPTLQTLFSDDTDERKAFLDALLPAGQVDNFSLTFPADLKASGSEEKLHGITTARVMDYRGEDIIISATRDITDFVAIQEELQQQREIAHQNEKLSALGELLAGVAHELNNPLSIVVGYALMLQERVEDPALRRKIERIGEAADRCAKIVKTFLAMARQRPVRLEECSLNEVAELAIDMSGYGLRSIGASLTLNLDPDLPTVMADPDQLAQVFSNLIINAEHAVDHLGAEGRVTIKTHHDRERALVVAEVCDNGRGIDPNIRDRIFEPFFTTKDVGVGTGVGLAFCHRVIDTHGGRIHVVSEPGEGARFMIELHPERAAQQVELQPSATSDVAKGRVLVVDDEQGITEMIRDVLEADGYKVEVCHRARDGLDLLRNEEFCVVLSDISMPDIDGEHFYEQLVADPDVSTHYLAFITGDAMSPSVSSFLQKTKRPYLEKPVVPGDLIQMVQDLCLEKEEGK